MVSPLKVIAFGIGAGVFASACVAPVGDEPVPEVATSALETQFDIPASAGAVQVNFGSQRDVWIFACDSLHRLRHLIKTSISTTFEQQPVLDTTCDSQPVIAKWDNPPDAAHRLAYTTVRVYGRYTDNQLWELYFEDSTKSGQFSWANLSDFTGFGPIKGSPVVADTGVGGEVSVVVKDPNNFLHTFDLSNFAWSTHPVTFSSGGTMTTLNTLSAQSSSIGIPIIAGRGFDASNDTQGWLARRTGGWNSSYVNWRTLNGGGTLVSNPAVSNDRVYAVFGSEHVLKSRAVTALSSTAWTTFPTGGCILAGSPVASPDFNSPFISIKGYGIASNGSLKGWSDNIETCQVLTSSLLPGGFSSAPSFVVGASATPTGPYAFDLVLRQKVANRLAYYHHSSNTVMDLFDVHLQ